MNNVGVNSLNTPNALRVGTHNCSQAAKTQKRRSIRRHPLMSRVYTYVAGA